MLPQLNLSRRQTTAVGSAQSFGKQAQEPPSKQAIAHAFQDAQRLHSQSYTNGRGPLKAYQHGSLTHGLSHLLSTPHQGAAANSSMLTTFLPSSSQ